MAAIRPTAVASSASAIPGATTARLVFCEIAICSKLCLIPQTVPNRPMNGAVDPTVARKLSPEFRFSLSLAMATSIDRSMRACAPAISPPSCRWLRRHSSMPAAKIFPLAPSGVGPIFSKSSSSGSPDQKARSKTLASPRALRNRICFWTMTAQDQKEDTRSMIITTLTVKVARRKRATSEKSISCAVARVWVSIKPARLPCRI